MLPTISTTTKTPIQKTAQKLHAIVLYEIADYPLLKVANGIGEWPGFDWNYFLCENYRYQIRIKERTWFSDYSLWFISHSLNPEKANYAYSGDITVYNQKYLTLASKLATHCHEFSGVDYLIRLSNYG